MAPQLGDVGLEASFGKQARDFRAQPASWGFICDHRIAQNVAKLPPPCCGRGAWRGAATVP